MKTYICIIGVICLIISQTYSQYATQGYDWDTYGDRYPTTFEKVYNEVPQFFLFEGPGNTNPGNGLALPQNELSISTELKTYLARQFTYILFDQESFCVRTYPWNQDSVTAMMTPKYHSEAQALMSMNPSLIVFPYFTFTLMHKAYPWYSSVPESWFLHQTGQPADFAHRIKAYDDRFFLMDISNAQWRSFYINWINTIVTTYGYRGIFLDNMTMYPWVTAAGQTQLPSGMFNNWLTHLTTFITELKATVGTSKPIVCNSLGMDDGDPNTPLLFGSNNGTNVVAQVSGGALMEGFHGTAWKWALDATLSVMNWMKTNNKIFLAATHYTRNEDALLSQRFGLAPLGANGWIDDATKPPLATFYRMQMSYLARFLLVSSSTQKFGYSFQPGVLHYQFIPYYKPWDEKIGTPIDANYVDMGTYYKREFSHAISYVNKSETNSLVITLPTSSDLYVYPYYGSVPSNNVQEQKYTPATITLNKMEGIVVFKRVTVDQKLEDGTTSADSVGHWINSKFIMYKAPSGIPLVAGTNEVLKATQKVLNNQKYNNWGDENILNHKTIQLQPGQNQIFSNFKQINTATIQTTVDGFPVSSPTSIEFKDPWLIDYNDQPYGDRNRGTNAIFRSIGTPYTANNPVYNGVFLNQDPASTQNYFSLRAKLTGSDLSGFTGYFQNWSYNSSQIDMPVISGESGYDTKAIVFKQSGATVTANYKALNVSSNAQAYSNNSQRKIVKDNFTSKVITAYESQGNIWIETSTNNGASWQFGYLNYMDNATSINTRAAKSPSLTTSGQITILTYQELNADPNYTDIKVVHLYYNPNYNYQLQLRTLGTFTVYNPSNLDLNPVSSNYYDVVVGGMSAMESGNYGEVVKVSTAWEEGGNVKIKCGPFYTNNSGSSVSWGTSVYTITNAHHAAMAANSSSSYIAWEQPNSSTNSDIKFMEYIVTDIGNGYGVQSVNQTTASSGSGFTKNYNPSIIAINGGARLCWIGYRENIGEEYLTSSQTTNAIGTSEQRVIFRDPYYNHFWQFGSNVSSPTITKSDDNSSYYILWSENNGQYNKFADGALSTIRTINTTGADVQVTNAQDKTSMFAIAFQTSLTPYRFSSSNTLGSYYSLAKGEANVTRTAREGIVSIGSSSTYFSLGDVVVDDQSISFVDVADTMSIVSVKELNSYLQTKPFVLSPKSNFTYNVSYGVLDTVFLQNAFKEKEFINYKIELVEVSTGKALGTFDDVQYSGSNSKESNNISWQVETSALTKETEVVLKLSVETNTSAEISFAEKYADEAMTGTGLAKSEKQKNMLKRENSATDYVLGTNYPNPFNPTTTINFALPNPDFVTLKVYDILGKEVTTLVNEQKEAGNYRAQFNASKLSSGIYIYRLTSSNFTLTKRMILLK